VVIYPLETPPENRRLSSAISNSYPTLGLLGVLGLIFKTLLKNMKKKDNPTPKIKLEKSINK
jgi:hypothetical protein